MNSGVQVVCAAKPLTELLGTVAVVVANVLVDIGYAVLDPRVRLT